MTSQSERVYEVVVAIRETGTRYVRARNAREAREKAMRGEVIASYGHDDAHLSGVRSVRLAPADALDFSPT